MVELLLTTIRPWQLHGRQGRRASAWSGCGQLLAWSRSPASASGCIDSILPGLARHRRVVWSIVWFLLGFLYALMFAALGSPVSRQEDVGGVTAPAIMLIILPYVLGISILPADPDNEFWRSLR